LKAVPTAATLRPALRLALRKRHWSYWLILGGIAMLAITGRQT